MFSAPVIAFADASYGPKYPVAEVRSVVVDTRFRARTGHWASSVERSPDRFLGVGECDSNSCLLPVGRTGDIDGVGGVQNSAEELNFGPFCSGVTQKSSGWELAVDDEEDGVAGDDSRHLSLPNWAERMWIQKHDRLD